MQATISETTKGAKDSWIHLLEKELNEEQRNIELSRKLHAVKEPKEDNGNTQTGVTDVFLQSIYKTACNQ